MSVYINMEMPQKTYAHCMLIKDIDGSVQLLVCTKDSGEKSEWESYDLVPVPPHGRLGDLDKLADNMCSATAGMEHRAIIMHEIRRAPTVLEAEEGET